METMKTKEKFEVRWQKLKKKRVNRQNYLRSTNVVLLLTNGAMRSVLLAEIIKLPKNLMQN